MLPNMPLNMVARMMGKANSQNSCVFSRKCSLILISNVCHMMSHAFRICHKPCKPSQSRNAVPVRFQEHIIERRLATGEMPDIRALVLQQLQYVDEIVIALAAVHRQLMAVIVGVGHERQGSATAQASYRPNLSALPDHRFRC